MSDTRIQKTRKILYYAVLGKFTARVKFMRHNSDVETYGAGNKALREFFLFKKFVPRGHEGSKEVTCNIVDHDRPGFKTDKKK